MDKVIVWKALTGNKIAEIKMPEPYFNKSWCEYTNKQEPQSDPTIEEMELAKENSEVNNVTISGSTVSVVSSELSPIATKKSRFAPDYSCMKPRATVQKLLLHGDQLLVFVGGYNTYISRQHLNPEDWPILEEYGSSQARIYDTSALADATNQDTTLPELKLLGSQNLPGRLTDGRSVQGIAHFVSTTRVNTHTHLDAFFNRWGERYRDMNRDEYIRNTTEYASLTVVPAFIKKFGSELKERHGSNCAGITQLSVFQTGDLGKEAEKYNWWGNGIFGGLVTISSLDLEMDLEAPTPEQSNSIFKQSTRYSASFLPNSWGTTVYAASNRLFLAGRGYGSDEELGYVEQTLIYGYNLSLDAGSSAKAIGVGKVRGNLLNQFSLDFKDGNLRVATTVWNRRINGPENRVSILRMPSDDPGAEPLMKMVGQTEPLGKTGESIFAVRFVNDLGFVVTIERIDPFIVLDLSNAENPIVTGELEIPGYSNYLHPTGDDYTLLAVGQDANKDGREMGLKISLFSFEDKKNPKQLATHTLDSKWSTSEVQWNHLAFRFLPESWRVILPASAYGNNNFFDGFYIFDVNKESEEITESFRVNLANRDVYYKGRCYYTGHFQARSMVFDDQVTLMKAHFVGSYPLKGNGTIANWKLDLDDGLPEDQCVYVY